MLRRAIALVLVVVVVAAACGSDAESGADVQVAPQPARSQLVPTTAPIEEPTPPLPTPVDLAGGAGITVEPTAVPSTPEPPPSTVAPTVAAATAVPAAPSTPAATPSSVAEASSPTPVPEPPAPPPGSGAGAGDPSNIALVANGSEVYTVTCARCHGETGAGTFIAQGLFTVSARYSVSSLTNELVNGHPYTFGFADKLTADQIDAVVSYVLASF